MGALGGRTAIQNPSNCSNGITIEENPLYTPSGAHTRCPCRDPEMGFSRFLVAVINCRRMGVGGSFLGALGELTAVHSPSNCSNGVRIEENPPYTPSGVVRGSHVTTPGWVFLVSRSLCSIATVWGSGPVYWGHWGSVQPSTHHSNCFHDV